MSSLGGPTLKKSCNDLVFEVNNIFNLVNSETIWIKSCEHFMSWGQNCIGKVVPQDLSDHFWWDHKGNASFCIMEIIRLFTTVLGKLNSLTIHTWWIQKDKTSLIWMRNKITKILLYLTCKLELNNIRAPSVNRKDLRALIGWQRCSDVSTSNFLSKCLTQ